MVGHWIYQRFSTEKSGYNKSADIRMSPTKLKNIEKPNQLTFVRCKIMLKVPIEDIDIRLLIYLDNNVSFTIINN